MDDSVRALILGGCLARTPLSLMHRNRTRLTWSNYGSMPGTHTLGDIFQVIGILRGERDVPQEIRPLCAMKSSFGPVAKAADFSDVDVALVEVSSPIEIVFRGCHLNRIRIQAEIVNPIAELGRAEKRCGNSWLRQGLMGNNEALRQQTAEKLVSYIPPDMENADLMRAVILETRSWKGDVAEGLRRVKDLVGRPIGVSLYIFQYLADGRALVWPAGFHDELIAATKQESLPLFDPSPIVRSYGVKEALLEDLKHYNDEFMPVIGDALVDFILSVRQNSQALAA